MTRQIGFQGETGGGEGEGPERFGSWEWIPEGGRLTCSPEIFEIFAEDPGSFEPTFEAYLEHIHPEDRDDVRETISTAVEACEPFVLEHRIIGGDGEVRAVQIQGQAVEASDGRAVRVVGICQDVTERRLTKVRLQYLADHDSLSGLVNRRRFTTELEQQIAFSDRYGGQGAVMIIDIDHFKRVNDSLGHHAGDNLIRHISALLAERVRTTDLVARLAGDEFAVLAPQVTREGARALAEDITGVLRDRAGHETGVGEITASVGIAMFGGDADSEEALVAADQAMYHAKEEGRDRIAVFTQVDDSVSRRERGQTSAARIREALQNDEFTLFQQPILDLGSRGVARRELLLRMRGNDGEPIPARLFIETAEQTGMIQEVDRWVVGRALEILGGSDEDVSLHVNISGASITDLAVIEFIERALDEGDADPTQITFEITETSAIQNISRAAGFADRLTEFGCEVAIDDYGTGFGPFSYLKHMPFDFIKIDGDFVRDLPRNDADQLTVKALVQIANGLGKRTIAEFVEEEETALLLRDYGVDMAQGYHLGRPAALKNGDGVPAPA